MAWTPRNKVLAIATVLAAATATLAVVLLVARPSSDAAATAGPAPSPVHAAEVDTSASPASEPAVATTAPATPPPPSIPDRNGDGHRRILLIGDSLLDRALTEFDQTFAAHGVEAQYRGYTNTGLLTQFPEDDGATWWSTQLNEGIADYAPDVVVFQSCCNYDGSYVGPDTSDLPPDSEAHYARWKAEAQMLTDTAQASGASAYWILSPSALPSTDVPWPLSRIERFNEIYRSLGVPFVDWQAALDAAEPTATEALRVADGVHLTDAGDQIVVDETWRVLTEAPT